MALGREVPVRPTISVLPLNREAVVNFQRILGAAVEHPPLLLEPHPTRMLQEALTALPVGPTLPSGRSASCTSVERVATSSRRRSRSARVGIAVEAQLVVLTRQPQRAIFV